MKIPAFAACLATGLLGSGVLEVPGVNYIGGRPPNSRRARAVAQQLLLEHHKLCRIQRLLEQAG